MADLITKWVEMRDAANPHAPGLASWGGPVQGYPNRIPPWTAADFALFKGGHMATSVRPEAIWAHVCREIDIETDSAQPRDIPGFILEREHLGHDDAGVYFSLDIWPEVRSHLVGASIGPSRVRLRVADWSVPPTRFDFGDGWVAWAHQFANLPMLGIDRNAVFGPTDFVR